MQKCKGCVVAETRHQKPVQIRMKRTKKFFSKRLNFRRWMSWEEIQRGGLNLMGLVKSALVIKSPEHVETFQEAMTRLKLSDYKLQRHLNLLFIRSKCFFLLSLLILGYAYYLIFYAGVVVGGAVTCLASGPSFALSFRDSFWAYQIRRKRLGCSIEEWVRDNFWVAKLWYRD